MRPQAALQSRAPHVAAQCCAAGQALRCSTRACPLWTCKQRWLLRRLQQEARQQQRKKWRARVKPGVTATQQCQKRLPLLVKQIALACATAHQQQLQQQTAAPWLHTLRPLLQFLWQHCWLVVLMTAAAVRAPLAAAVSAWPHLA